MSNAPFYQRHKVKGDRKQPLTTNPSAKLELKGNLYLTMSFARVLLQG